MGGRHGLTGDSGSQHVHIVRVWQSQRRHERLVGICRHLPVRHGEPHRVAPVGQALTQFGAISRDRSKPLFFNVPGPLDLA